MAVDTDDIREVIREEMTSIDAEVDVDKGWLLDWVIEPVAQTGGVIAEPAERLRRLYSPRFARVARFDEAIAFSESHGVGRDPGRASTGTQTFFTYTKPVVGETRTIRVGQTVRRPDGRGFRVTTHSLELTGANADAYFNSTTGRWELDFPVEALSMGPEFDTPRGLVTQIDGQVDGWDGTVNKTDISGGLDAETPAETVDTTASALLGNDIGTHGGILRSALLADPDVDGVSLAFFTEYDIFLRREFRPAVDVHVIGSRPVEVTEIFIAEAGQTDYTLLKPPAIQVTSFKKNNGAATYELVKDSDRRYAESYRATDKIQFDAMAGGEVCEVLYQYEGIIRSTQENLFSGELTATNERTNLFNSDILVRKALNVPLEVTVRLSLQANADESEAEAEAEEQIRAYCSADEFPGLLNPTTLRDLLIENVPGIIGVQIQLFRRKEGAQPRSGLIEFNKIEKGHFAASSDIVINT